MLLRVIKTIDCTLTVVHALYLVEAHGTLAVLLLSLLLHSHRWDVHRGQLVSIQRPSYKVADFLMVLRQTL